MSNTPNYPLKESRSTPLTFKATKRQKEAIRAAAHEQGKSVSTFLHEIITNHLNK